MSCLISDFNIIPSYGKNICRLNWSAASEVGAYPIAVWKSRDGYTDWYQCGTVETAISGTYVDTEFYNTNNIYNWSYKLILSNGTSNIYTTPSRSIFDKISKEEFSYLKGMITNEILTKDTREVYLCRPLGKCGEPLINNNLSTNVNVLTGDIVGKATDTVSYGKFYKTGYSVPIRTLISVNTPQLDYKDDPEGLGYAYTDLEQIKSLSFPRWMIGDLIVDVQTDERWLLDKIVSETKFKGMFPFTFIGIIRSLPRNAIEYKYDLRGILESGGCL